MAVWGTAWRAPVLHFPIHQPHQPRCPSSGSGFLPPADASPGLQSPRNRPKISRDWLSAFLKKAVGIRCVLYYSRGGLLNLFNREQILVAAGVCDILCGLQGHCEPADFHLLFLGGKYHPLLETGRNKNVSCWSSG